jgi:hypothetical protein
MHVFMCIFVSLYACSPCIFAAQTAPCRRYSVKSFNGTETAGAWLSIERSVYKCEAYMPIDLHNVLHGHRGNLGPNTLCVSNHSHNQKSDIPMVQQPVVDQDLLTLEDSRSHSDTPRSVGLLWTSDQADAETSTSQHTSLTRERHPCPRWNWNSQSQQASGRRPTPYTAQKSDMLSLTQLLPPEDILDFKVYISIATVTSSSDACIDGCELTCIYNRTVIRHRCA